jgi:anti-anti-sigma regulatory factor
MLKISQPETSGGTSTLRVEGTLSGAWVPELRASCDAILAEGRRVVLDLNGVVYVDRSGTELLETLRADSRVTLDRVSAFVAALLNGGAA